MTHVEGDVNPVRDIDIINEELRLKDEEYLHAQIDKLEKALRGDKKGKPELVRRKNPNPKPLTWPDRRPLARIHLRFRFVWIVDVDVDVAQDILLKIRGVLVDEKKHIRYGDWNAYDVSTTVWNARKARLMLMNGTLLFGRSKCSTSISSSRPSR